MKGRVGSFMAAFATAVMHDSILCIQIQSSTYTGQFNDLSQCTIGQYLATVLNREIWKWNNASVSSSLPIKGLKIMRLTGCVIMIKEGKKKRLSFTKIY